MDVENWYSSVRPEPDETECDIRSATAASLAAAQSGESWPPVTVGGREGELLVVVWSAVEPPNTTVGSVSSELVRSMTIVTPVELIGLISTPGLGEVKVLPEATPPAG